MLAFATWALYMPITRGWIFVVYYLFAIPIWVIIVPLVLRDVWRKNRIPPPEPPIVLPPEPPAVSPEESIQSRRPPTRW
ncbi:MAG TPA: hypothetical protein VHB69_14505 [Mycobacteriales bacterium]|nr:hypothetical protein [Mycobacteriales bacterium]